MDTLNQTQKTKGKKRGYIERSELDLSTGDEPIKINVNIKVKLCCKISMRAKKVSKNQIIENLCNEGRIHSGNLPNSDKS